MSWKENNVTLVIIFLLLWNKKEKKKTNNNIFCNSKALPQVISRIQYFLDVSITVQNIQDQCPRDTSHGFSWIIQEIVTIIPQILLQPLQHSVHFIIL